MTITASTKQRSAAALLFLTLAWLVWLFVASPVRAAVRRAAALLGREARYWAGRPAAVQASRERRWLPAQVPDPVVADRVRAALLGLERRWDIRRIHVDAEDRVVILHGQVPSSRAARTVEAVALRVPGVAGVESYLHVGPIHEGARPSPGMRYPEPSEARRRLLQAAYAAGAPADLTLPIVRAVLGLIADRIPPEELDQLTVHLPRDVTALCQRPKRNGQHRRPVHGVTDLMADLTSVTDPLDAARARRVVEAVLGTLRDLVPEEAGDIAAVLPADLRSLWLSADAG